MFRFSVQVKFLLYLPTYLLLSLKINFLQIKRRGRWGKGRGSFFIYSCDVSNTASFAKIEKENTSYRIINKQVMRPDIFHKEIPSLKSRGRPPLI